MRISCLHVFHVQVLFESLYSYGHFLQCEHNNHAENKIRKPRVKRTTEFVDRVIVRKFKIYLREVLKEINSQFRINLSDRLIRCRLNHRKLFGRSSRKKPVLTKENYSQAIVKLALTRMKSCQSG